MDLQARYVHRSLPSISASLAEAYFQSQSPFLVWGISCFCFQGGGRWGSLTLPAGHIPARLQSPAAQKR